MAVKHSKQSELISILSGPTQMSSKGYPYISNSSFQNFLSSIPHLFTNGSSILNWLIELEKVCKDHGDDFTQEEFASLQRSSKVIKNIIYSSSITSPADLWLLRQIASTWSEIGISQKLLIGESFDLNSLVNLFGLDHKQFQTDVDFLHCRGILDYKDEHISLSNRQESLAIMNLPVLGEEEKSVDWVKRLAQFLSGSELVEKDIDAVNTYLSLPSHPYKSKDWIANAYEVELAYKILPIVLAMRVLNWTEKLIKNPSLDELFKERKSSLLPLLIASGYSDTAGLITPYGARVMQRGPGPFGIIQTYRKYMIAHTHSLQGKEHHYWVSRGENVAASQDANKKTFRLANEALDRFCKDHNHRIKVFIEHAVGHGEGIRQRFERDGEESIQYFGADLEEAAINAARARQQQGILPQNMRFIKNADIGHPHLVMEELKQGKFASKGAIMMVGNGFHEVRQQNNDKMVEIFRGYCQAGIILLFTEESGLSNQDLLETAWNTYHASFRYVHEISGQGLRPSIDKDDNDIYSWHKCASLAGYAVLAEYCSKTRSIFPHPKKDGYNPSISVNYFCVPADLFPDL